MGSTYKLKPYLVKFIKKQKIANPALSCRSLADIIFKKYDIKVSKSSINKIFKELGLNQPPGRKAHKLDNASKKNMDNMGIFFLKTADIYLGLGEYLSSLCITHLNEKNKKQAYLKNNTILFQRLLTNRYIGLKTSIEESVYYASEGIVSNKVLYPYLAKMQEVTALYSDFVDSIPAFLRTVSAVKIDCNKTSIFLDSGLRSVLFDGSSSNADIVTHYKIESYIKEHLFDKDDPLVVLSSNSMNIYQEVVCNFLESSFIKTINFTDKSNKTVERLPADNRQLNAVVGLFPQDFAATQSIKTKSAFRAVADGSGNTKFIAEADAIFTQQAVNKQVTVRCVVVRSSALGMEDFILLTNIAQSNMSAEQIFKLFISHWPNPQDTYYKMSIQGNSSGSKQVNSYNILQYNKLGDDSIFDICLEILNHYFQRLFFSPSWKIRGLAFMKENFYNLPGAVKTTSANQQISIKINRNHPFLTEIGSACEKINQSSLKNLQKKTLQIDLSFK